jgi:hypothetical protein
LTFNSTSFTRRASTLLAFKGTFYTKANFTFRAARNARLAINLSTVATFHSNIRNTKVAKKFLTFRAFCIKVILSTGVSTE